MLKDWKQIDTSKSFILRYVEWTTF